ncbi:helix-turn-helix transcriptional regulator [Brevibacillus nitrificans]|uniref:helix-turn-helix transcriptional regulator n=1 Tax=Brevibacillus nitrificans TaxID=651560 RepID=UPI00285893D3|nr:helix-turn-helix transcriptional regulator [Brevibacillus nitrificans]MDR7313845.1 AraC-like DNA-binding protein [Brevibacillus nitrificans]
MENAEIDALIAYIHRYIDEPLPLSRLASYVSYSPYHFTRLFKERMGLPPLYYVSSLRLQKAKDLLIHTNMSVRDIGLEIGQQSLGTFSSRFTEKVGVSPTEFRNSVQATHTNLHALRSLGAWQLEHPVSPGRGRVVGTVHSEYPFEGVILIGLFAKPIPEGLPLYGTVLSSLGHFCFTGVKPGTYYLMATSVLWEMQAAEILLPHTTLRTRSKESIVVSSGAIVPHRDAWLYPPAPDDPPILISLPLLVNNFLTKISNPHLINQ